MLGDDIQQEQKKESSIWKIILPFIVAIIAIVLTIILTTPSQQPQNPTVQQVASTIPTVQASTSATPKPIEYGNLTITVTDADTGQPLEGVTVKLNSLQETTDNNGIAIFTVDNQGETGTLYFSKDGYENNSFDVVLSQGSQELKLYAQTQTSQDNLNTDNPNPSSGNTTVYVYVDDQPAVDGTVELRGQDDTLIDSAVVQNGTATFQNIPDQQGYAVYSNDQFTDQQSDVFSLMNGEISIYAYSDSYSQENGFQSTQGLQTKFLLINNNGKPGELQVFTDNNTVAFKGELDEITPLSLGLKDGQQYTASFVSLGRVTKIDSFQAGDNVTIDANNNTDQPNQTSSNLVIKTFFTQQPVDDVTVDVMQGDNIIAEEISQNGTVELTLDQGDYEIKAVKDYAMGFATVSLTSSKIISMNLNTGSYLLKTSLQDENNTSLQGFVTVAQDNVTQKCPTIKGICIIPVQQGDVIITGSADGYQDAQATRTITSDDFVNLTLIKNLETVQDSTIDFLGFYKNGEKKNYLTYGQEYDLAFNVIAKTDSILYLRVSDDQTDLLGIDGQSLNSKNVKFKSSTYSDTTDCAESINFNEGTLGYKWTAIRVNKGVQNIPFTIKVSDKVIGSVSTQIYYKLGLESEFTCHDNTQNTGVVIYGLGADNSTFTSTQADVINTLNTPSDPESASLLVLSVGKDGVLTANKDAQEFIIDNVFPADSTPFKVPDGVTLTFQGPYQDCFSQVTSGSNKYLLLKTSYVDSKSTCPIKEANGKITIDDTKKTILKAAYFDPKGSATILQLPLTITVRNINSIIALPTADQPASYSRTIFVGSQSAIPTQLTLGTIVQDFNGPDLQLKIWDGQNSPLTLTADGTNVKTWNWRQQPNNPIGLESLAPTTTTQGSDACTGYFCNSDQLQASVQEFKKSAAEFFSSTYNRRGEGHPYTLIYGTNYNPKYYGGFMANANNPLNAQGFDVAYTNKPATYKAWGEINTGSNGIVNVNWKATFYEVQAQDYVSGNCDNSTTDLNGYQSSNGCIHVSDSPNVATVDQTSVTNNYNNGGTSNGGGGGSSNNNNNNAPPTPIEETVMDAPVIMEFTPLMGPVSIQAISGVAKLANTVAGVTGGIQAILNNQDLLKSYNTAVDSSCKTLDDIFTGGGVTKVGGVATGVPFIETAFVVNYSNPNFTSNNITDTSISDVGSDFAQSLDITGISSLVSSLNSGGSNLPEATNLSSAWGSSYSPSLTFHYLGIPRWTYMRFTTKPILGLNTCVAVCRYKAPTNYLDVTTTNETKMIKGQMTNVSTTHIRLIIRRGVSTDCRSQILPGTDQLLKLSKPQDLQNNKIQQLASMGLLEVKLSNGLCEVGSQIVTNLAGIQKGTTPDANMFSGLVGMPDNEVAVLSKYSVFSGAVNTVRNSVFRTLIQTFEKNVPEVFDTWTQYVNPLVTLGGLGAGAAKINKQIPQCAQLTAADLGSADKVLTGALDCVIQQVGSLVPGVGEEQQYTYKNVQSELLARTANMACDIQWLTATRICIGESDKASCVTSSTTAIGNVLSATLFADNSPTPSPSPKTG
ncbi:Uncharacterised protein [uncultured archaeon]|nr:Uncharacterised protein [uncultured archaeon]